MNFYFASVYFAAEPDEPGYQWPASALESFLRQNAARADETFTHYLLDAYRDWRTRADGHALPAGGNGPFGITDGTPFGHATKAPKDGEADHPFDAFFNISDETMRGFLRLLPHRIPFATAVVLTGMEASDVEALAASLRGWLATTQTQAGLHERIQLGFDPLAAELTCPCCNSGTAPVFFGLSWHRIQLYRCDACGHLFEAHQGMREDTVKTAGNNAVSSSHI